MRKATLPILAALLLTAGCGDQIVGPGGTVPVAITGSGITPQTVNIPRGATVRWTNNTSAIHRLVAANNAWDSGEIPPAETYSRQFTSFGTFAYSCALHDGETGTVLVD